jgi:predicted RNase H-like HicB family nuclease
MDAKSYIFKVRVEEDHFEDGRKAFHAFCPALKGCHTWGHTYPEALTNLREAVELYVDDLRQSGESIPLDAGRDVEAWPTPAVAINV